MNVYFFFKKFSGGFTLLELEMVNFLPVIFKLLFRGARFAHYLRMFSRFFQFLKSGNKGQWYFAGLHYQEILFD